MKNIILLACLLSLVGCAYLPEYLQTEGVRKKHPIIKTHWVLNNDPEYFSGNLPIALNSPAIDNGILYVGHNKGSMQSYNLENGRLLWSKEDKSQYHSGPIISNDLVIYGTVSGLLNARKTHNGELVYSVQLGASIESDPVIYNGRMFVHTREHKIFCLDAKTGKILWAYKRAVPFLTTLQRVSTPVIYKNKLFVGFSDGVVASFSVEEGILIWEKKISQKAKFIDVDTSAVFFNGKLFMGSFSGPLTMLNPNTGKILRRFRDYSISRKPLVSGNQMYLGTVDGEIVILNRRLKEVKKIKVSNKPITSIVWWKGHLALSTVEGSLLLMDIETSKIIGRKDFGHATSAIFGNMKVYQDKLAVLSSRNRLYVFK